MNKIEFIKLDNFDIEVPVVKQEFSETTPSYFISVGEYPCYDTNSYEHMNNDEYVGILYSTALIKSVLNKRVLDIGTGEFVNWALKAYNFGAIKSVGLEILEESYKKAKEKVDSNKVELINILSLNYKPEEKFDVIVSEIIGNIGSSEGVISVLNDARKRLLKPDGKMIPSRCKTFIGGICAQENIVVGFNPDTIPYLNKIFDHYNEVFDIRLTLDSNYPNLLMTNGEVVEDLIFDDYIEPESNTNVQLKVTQDGYVDGFLLWIELYVEDDVYNKINTLWEESRWENVYFPVYDTPIEVKKDDVINVNFYRNLNEDKIHHDYVVYCNINGKHSKSYKSFHNETKFHHKKIYKQLFNYLENK